MTVAEALALSDRQLWQLGEVTVTGCLHANRMISCLVDQPEDCRGIFIVTDPTEGEIPFSERIMNSDCLKFAIGGGTRVFYGPTEVRGMLRRMSFPMFPLSMHQISRIVYQGVEAIYQNEGHN